MSNKYHAVERSSYFAVKDKDTFVRIMRHANIEWWEGATPSTEGKIAIRGNPCFPIYIKKLGGDDLTEFDIRRCIQESICEDEACVLEGVSSEGMQHIEGWAALITKAEIKEMTLSNWVSLMLENLNVTTTDFNY